MKINFLILLTLSLSTFANAQKPKVEWTKAIGGVGNERTNSVHTDHEGNIILVGRFQSPVIQVDNITLTKNKKDSINVADIFIIKLDTNGKAIWAVTAGDKGDDHATSCVTDQKGNIYVVGWFESKVLNLGKIALKNKTEKGSDMYLAKFSSNGECIWAHNAGGEGGCGDYSTIGLDKDNNVLISGIAGTIMDFGNGFKFTHKSSGIYVAKYSNDGQLIWAKSPEGSGEAQGLGIDKEGNVFIGGYFVSEVAFDNIKLNSQPDNKGDAYVAKYGPDGKAIWAKRFGGEDGEIASCETDGLGNIYLGGLYFSKKISTEVSTLTNNGLINAFMAKYNRDGNLLWAKSAGGNNGEAPGTAIREFFVDEKGNAYCTGSNWSEFNFAGTTIKPIAESEDIFIIKYDKDGNEIWGMDYGGTGRNAGRGITTDKNGNIFLTGSFDEKELKIDQHTLKNVGDSDIFLVKYKENIK